MKPPSGSEKQTQSKPIVEGMNVNFCAAGYYRRVVRAYPDNRVVMRPSEKSEAKATGQKGSEAWFYPR